MPTKSQLKLRTWLCWGFALILLCLPLLTNPYTQFVANSMLIYAIATLGFTVLIGHLGQLAFTNIAFFGIGAYASAIATQTFGLPWVLSIPIAAAAGAAAGFLVSAAALRGIRLYYLAIITLAFGD